MTAEIEIQKLSYNKKDYKIKGLRNSPAGTLKDWKRWADENKFKIKIEKGFWTGLNRNPDESFKKRNKPISERRREGDF